MQTAGNHSNSTVIDQIQMLQCLILQVHGSTHGARWHTFTTVINVQPHLDTGNKFPDQCPPSARTTAATQYTHVNHE